MRTFLAAAVLLPALAQAFTIESVATQGCHEKVTTEALARSRWPEGATPAAAEAALTQSLAFTTPAGADLWTVSLLIGARDNDLHGVTADDFAELSALHNAASGQEEHCLRAPADDGLAGDQHAVEACRAYILSELAAALGDAETVDLSATDARRVGLRYEQTTLTLPRYPLHVGKALHALQDSFTHGYRAPGLRQLTTVFNYADPATSPHYVAARDGVAHRSDFDACAGGSQAEQERVEGAVSASAQLLDAVGAAGTRTERLARADAVLGTWVTLADGCSADNAWCGGEEPVAHGCSTTGGLPALGLAALALLARRRTRRV